MIAANFVQDANRGKPSVWTDRWGVEVEALGFFVYVWLREVGVVRFFYFFDVGERIWLAGGDLPFPCTTLRLNV